MSLQTISFQYNGADLTGAANFPVFIDVPFAGTLKALDIKTDLAVSGDVVFELYINGILAPSANATITTGNKTASISGLNITLTKFDEITLKRVSGSVSAPLTLNLTVDDGISGGTALPAGDLNAATNTVEKVQNTAFQKLPSTVFLVDNFNAPSIDFTKWQILTSAGSYSQTNGELRYAAANGAQAFEAVKTINAVGKSFSVELKQIVGGSSGNHFMINISGLARFGFIVANNLLYFQFGTNNTSIAYNSVSHRWLRFRTNQDASVGYWETSPDGETWTLQRTQPNFNATVDLTTTTIRLQCNSNGTSGTQIWDNFSSDVVLTPSASDKSLYLYNAGTGSFAIYSLSELKAALAAAP